MKETPGRRITVTSSLKEISTVQQGVAGGGGGLLRPPPSLPFGQMFKDDMNGFSSNSDICRSPYDRCYIYLMNKIRPARYNK